MGFIHLVEQPRKRAFHSEKDRDRDDYRSHRVFWSVLIGSIGLISPHQLGGLPVPDSSRVSPILASSDSYLVLTIAEFVPQHPWDYRSFQEVAPPRFQWPDAGRLAPRYRRREISYWLSAAFLGGTLDLWQLWAIFTVCCLLSALFIFSIMKRLERVTNVEEGIDNWLLTVDCWLYDCWLLTKLFKRRLRYGDAFFVNMFVNINYLLFCKW